METKAEVCKTACQCKVGYISVGMGSIALYQMAKHNGWKLFAYVNNTMSGGWLGDSPYKHYYLKK